MLLLVNLLLWIKLKTFSQNSSIFKWDSFSDQPYQIRDRKEKKKLKQKNIWNIFATTSLSLLLFPIFLFRLLFPIRKSDIDISEFFGVGINFDKGLEQIELLKELNLKNINIRFPLSDMDRIDEYIEFVKKFKNYNILLTVLQNRENIENSGLFKKNIQDVFTKFSEIRILEFQIGNATNRSKWGFFSITEYLKFYKTAFDIRNRYFPKLKLVGSGVIDFEYYNTIHTLFNFQKINYDVTSSLLYVDRRGAPENRQSIIFNLEKKIELLWGLVKISKKTENRIYITETNYPIRDTAPYTPTSQFETVSLDDYKKFMVRYFLISLSTQMVERVYWHQLVSAGYGLIDNREKKFKKYPAFHTFKVMLNILDGRKYLSHNFSKNLHIVRFRDLEIYWTLSDEVQIQFQENKKVLDIDGNIENRRDVVISTSPIYIL